MWFFFLLRVDFKMITISIYWNCWNAHVLNNFSVDSDLRFLLSPMCLSCLATKPTWLLSILGHVQFHITFPLIFWHGRSYFYWPCAKWRGTANNCSFNKKIKKTMVMVRNCQCKQALKQQVIVGDTNCMNGVDKETPVYLIIYGLDLNNKLC